MPSANLASKGVEGVGAVPAPLQGMAILLFPFMQVATQGKRTVFPFSCGDPQCWCPKKKSAVATAFSQHLISIDEE